MPMPRSAASPDEIRATVTVVTFDLYGTVVDMQTGLTAAVTPYLRARRAGAAGRAPWSPGGGAPTSSTR